ncbi:MAG TPA: phage holin family protein [Patescibacteria group bacterium]
MKLVMKLAINVFALLVVAYIVPGFNLDNLTSAIVAAVVIGVVNTFIKPILQLIALPISLLTFGIAAFLINVALLWAVSLIVPGFTISSFATAIIASIALSLISWFLHKLARE